MDVSIIIPTKNGGSILENVLKSIFSQKTDFEFEVICIDSGSSDNTIETIKQFNCKIFHIPPEEFGHGRTRNYGASKAKGEYLLFITQDALPANELWINNFITTMKENPDAVGGFGIHYPYPNCNIFDAKDIKGLFEGFGDKTTIFQLEDKKRYEHEEGYRHYLSYYSDNNSCMRKEIWNIIPYDDVDFAEDQIWARKIIELGYKKLYCPSAAVYHSHNYKLSTYFSRYYDEYKGLWKLHQYRLVTNKKMLILKCLKHIYNEWQFTIKKDNLSFFKKIKWMNYSFWRNQFRYYAGFIAGKYHLYDQKKQEKLDKKYSQQYKQRKT